MVGAQRSCRSEYIRAYGPSLVQHRMASLDAFAQLPDDVLTNIIQWAASDSRGFAGSSKRLLKAFRACCSSLRLSGEDGLALSQLSKDRAFSGIRSLRYDLTCGHLTATAATAALVLAADAYPDLSHVSLVSHEAPADADPLLLGTWRSSIQGLAPLVEQLLVLQRCRALVSLHLTFAGQMVAALVPLRGLTGLTQLRLAGLPREGISNHIFLRDLARLKPLRLRDMALDCLHVLDMYAVWFGDDPSPYPTTLTRLELSRSRRTGEHLPALAACPELRTLDICYGGGVQYQATDRLDMCLSEHASCLQHLHTLHVRRYDAQEQVNFSLPNPGFNVWGAGAFVGGGFTTLTSLTQLSGKDWNYYVHDDSWQHLGTLPQLQAFSAAACCDWPPLCVSLTALQQLACRVVYRPLTPELLWPPLLRALPNLQKLEAVVEWPPVPAMDRGLHAVDDPDFDQLPLHQRVTRQQALARNLIDHLRLATGDEEQAERMQSLLVEAIVAPEQERLAICTQMCQTLHTALLAVVQHTLAQRPATAGHLTRLVLRCCCSPQRAPRMVTSCKALPPLVPALQQLELTFPLQPELVPGLLKVVACLTRLTSLALTAEAWPPAPEAAAGDAAVGPGGAEGGAAVAHAGNQGDDGGAAAAAAAAAAGGGGAAAAAAGAAAGGAAVPEGTPSAAAAGGSAGIQQGPQLAAHGSASDEEMSAAEPAGAASQQATGGSSSLQAAAHAAAEAVTASLSGWHPLQQDGQLGPPLPSPGAGVTIDAQGGCAVSAEALAAAVVPLQQLQVLTIQGFAGVCPARLAALLLHYRPASQLRRLRHRECGVVCDASTVKYTPAVRLLEAIPL